MNMSSYENEKQLKRKGFDKVFWVGRHPMWRSQMTGKPLTSPLGRLPSSVIKILTKEYGWEEIDNFEHDYRLPMFTFCSRKPTDDFYPMKYTSDQSSNMLTQIYGIAFNNDIDTSSQELIKKIYGDTVESYRSNFTEKKQQKIIRRL